MTNLLDASSPSLILTHPTPLEIHRTHELSSIRWAGALTKEQYIENEAHLVSVLAEGNGIAHWILTQSHVPPDNRPILASCETIPKRCLLKDGEGDVRDGVVHGVAGVFCDPQMRGRGYASRMMKELAAALWRLGGSGGDAKSVGSVLWSDIGPKFYADLGWAPFPTMHVELPASRYSPNSPTVATAVILAEDIEEFCSEDSALLGDSMAAVSSSKTLLAIVPDRQTMLWHHKKEEYICWKLFGKQSDVKGAVVGETGNRVWAIWTREFYGPLSDLKSGNKLYILRLVIEDPDSENSEEQAEQLKAVLEAAQNEATEWKLGHVELWNPDEKVRGLIQLMGIEHRMLERENEAIPSLLWFGEGIGNQDAVEWIANERFAWC